MGEAGEDGRRGGLEKFVPVLMVKVLSSPGMQKQFLWLPYTSFQDALHRKIFVDVGPMQPCAIADNLNILKCFCRSPGKSFVLLGWEPDLTTVLKPHADPTVVNSHPGCSSRLISFQKLHATSSESHLCARPPVLQPLPVPAP